MARRSVLNRWLPRAAHIESGGIMEHHLAGPMIGIFIVGGAAALITLGCFVAAMWLLIHPGETDPRHPKYIVLRHDR